MDFGQRLKGLRLDRGYTQQQLSSAVGVSVVALRSWEKNAKKPAMDTLLSLGRTLSVSMDTLLDFQLGNASKSSLVLSSAEKGLLKKYRALDDHGKKVVDTLCAIEAERVSIQQRPAPRKVINIEEARAAARYIPHFTSPSAAGVAAPIDVADFGMMLADDSVPDAADFAVDIQGNSMEPYIHDGDTVYVRRDAELSIGDVGIFCVDGAMYCKQYYLDEDRNLILVSANPDLRDTNVFVSADSGHSVQACGKVLLDVRLELPDYLFED